MVLKRIQNNSCTIKDQDIGGSAQGFRGTGLGAPENWDIRLKSAQLAILMTSLHLEKAWRIVLSQKFMGNGPF